MASDDGLYTVGRSKTLRADAWPTECGAVLRVDDARDGAFWLEVRLGERRLRELLAGIEQYQRAARDADRFCEHCGRPDAGCAVCGRVGR
jgi:hypothetical protein